MSIYVSSVLFHVLVAHLFLVLSSTPLPGWTSLSIHLLKDILIAPNFGSLNKAALDIS